MTDTDRLDALAAAEAGDYIEDDPAAWRLVVEAVRQYAPQHAELTAHLGSADGATEVLAGAIVSYLASGGAYISTQRDAAVRERDELREAAIDILDVIDGIVDDTHPEGDGCPLCTALDDLRNVLERAARLAGPPPRAALATPARRTTSRRH